MNTYQILLYYKYVRIKDPEKIRNEQKELCQKLGLTGRIIIAGEGSNGTVEGTVADTEKYIEEMKKDALFDGMQFKRSRGTGTAFPKLSVKVRPEVVTSKVEGLDPLKKNRKVYYIRGASRII